MQNTFKKSFVFEFFVFSVLLAIVAGVLGIASYKMNYADYASNEISVKHKRIIIDAGHGGIDGGATGTNGVLEKDLNLTIAKKSAEIFKLCGYDVIMTRNDDISLGQDAPKGKQKMTDLVKRREIAEQNPDAVFFSIHMNKFPQEPCKGFQAWYSPNNDLSKRLADIVSNSIKTNFQPENHRESKKASSAIYLLDRIKNVSVLAECGFVSNPAECENLCDESYQNKLAACFYFAVNDFYKNVG